MLFVTHSTELIAAVKAAAFLVHYSLPNSQHKEMFKWIKKKLKKIQVHNKRELFL